MTEWRDAGAMPPPVDRMDILEAVDYAHGGGKNSISPLVIPGEGAGRFGLRPPNPQPSEPLHDLGVMAHASPHIHPSIHSPDSLNGSHSLPPMTI